MPDLSAAAIRYIIIVAGIILLGLAIVLGLNQCQERKRADKQAEVSAGQAGASIASGAEAGNTLANVAENAATADQAVAQGQSDVRAAHEADKGSAAVNAACRFKANRNKPQCQPKGPAR
jgi:hypothetical protein